MCPFSLSSPNSKAANRCRTPGGAGVGGAHPATRRPAWFLTLAADRGPLPSRTRLQVEQLQLIHAKDDLRVAVGRGDLVIGHRVQVLDARLLRRIPRAAFSNSRIVRPRV